MWSGTKCFLNLSVSLNMATTIVCPNIGSLNHAHKSHGHQINPQTRNCFVGPIHRIIGHDEKAQTWPYWLSGTLLNGSQMHGNFMALHRCQLNLIHSIQFVNNWWHTRSMTLMLNLGKLVTSARAVWTSRYAFVMSHVCFSFL